ncbi:MAG: hypothetical protein PHE48_00295 [Candidatus Daviesbacteria bacterium]|nr:hypothetical protein [Candidatus Daviesbacteria bacterium]
MRLKECLEGTPIYLCGTPAVGFRESWYNRLRDEIFLHLQALNEKTLLRGSHAEDLKTVARTGTDQPYLSMTYVVPCIDICSIDYPFGIATTIMLVYRSSALREMAGDAENMGVDFNRYEFITDPKEALLGIIDLREVKKRLKTLPSIWD